MVRKASWRAGGDSIDGFPFLAQDPADEGVGLTNLELPEGGSVLGLLDRHAVVVSGCPERGRKPEPHQGLDRVVGFPQLPGLPVPVSLQDRLGGHVVVRCGRGRRVHLDLLHPVHPEDPLGVPGFVPPHQVPVGVLEEEAVGPDLPLRHLVPFDAVVGEGDLLPPEQGVGEGVQVLLGPGGLRGDGEDDCFFGSRCLRRPHLRIQIEGELPVGASGRRRHGKARKVRQLVEAPDHVGCRLPRDLDGAVGGEVEESPASARMRVRCGWLRVAVLRPAPGRPDRVSSRRSFR